MKNGKRIFCVLMAICIAFCVLTSVFYIANETSHDCAGEFCTVCANLSFCENLLGNVGVGIIAVFCASLIAHCVKLVTSGNNTANKIISLYTLKVKLSI